VSRNAVVRSPVSYNGLRLMRKGTENFAERLSEAHRRSGSEAPALSRDVWDHDTYALRIGNPLGRKRD
jgi:hypothetical protein